MPENNKNNNTEVEFVDTDIVEGVNRHWYSVNGTEYGLNESTETVIDADGNEVKDETVVNTVTEAYKSKSKSEQNDDDDDNKDKDDDNNGDDGDKDDDEEEVTEKMKKKVAKRESYRDEDQPEPETKATPDNKKKKNKAKKVEENFIKLLDESEAELSEEFKEKVSTLFVTSVNEATNDEVERIEENAQKEIDKRMEEYENKLSERVNEHINYVAEKFVHDNELAIENGLKLEMYENFFNGVKSAFTEANVEIPEGSDSIVTKIEEENTKLQEQLEEQHRENLAMREVFKDIQKEQIFNQVCENLTLTQKEKLSKLVEDIEFTGEERYRGKLETIKENYFPGDSTSTDEDEVAGADLEEEAKTFRDAAQKRYANRPGSDLAERTLALTKKSRFGSY